MAVISLGADPEVLVRTTGELKPVPAWTLTKGTKTKPEPLEGARHGVKLQADGTALEFNFDPLMIDTRAPGIGGLEMRTLSAFSDIKRWLARRKGNFTSLGTEDGCAEFTSEEFMHPLALVNGCDPDYDAYSENPKIPRTKPSVDPELKLYGGHIHIGYNTELCPPHVFVRLLDILLLPYMREHQPFRRKVHGLAGLFRYKPYGLEYRTPGTAWFTRTDVNIARTVSNIVNLLEDEQQVVRDFYKSIEWGSVQEMVAGEEWDNLLALSEPFVEKRGWNNPKKHRLLRVVGELGMPLFQEEAPDIDPPDDDETPHPLQGEEF